MMLHAVAVRQTPFDRVIRHAEVGVQSTKDQL
jgi:hypothetical protein